MQALQALTHKTRRVIALGFGLLLTLLVLINLVSLTRMSNIKVELESISSNHHAKADIINSMHKIVSKRSLVTYLMVITDDAFEQDQLYLHFNELATRFVVLREQLMKLPLTAEEKHSLNETFQLIRETQPIQEAIVSSILDGKDKEVTQRIILKEWPGEREIYNRFNAIIELEQHSSNRSIERANQEYRDALLMMSVLNGIILIIGVLIAALVIKRTATIESELFREQKLAQFTLESMSVAVITTDIDGRIIYCNPVAERLLQASESSLVGKAISDVFVIEDETKNLIDLEHFASSVEKQNIYFENASLKLCDGLMFLVQGSAMVSHNDAGQIIGSAIVIRDVSETRNLEDQLSWQATHDALTGLSNRREFERLLKSALNNAQTEQQTHSVLYIDLDQFKIVNDTCGHIAGDQLLQQLTSLLQQEVRGSDTLARLGGDEFGLLLESCPLSKADQIAGQILSVIQAFRFAWKDKIFKIGASIGVATIDESSESISAVLSAADSACYVAKDKGRNRVWLHYPDDKEINKRHTEMELTSRINHALENRRFILYKQRIQPVKASKDQNIYEILIRMLDEQGNQMMPMAFIPAAERYSIMPNIDRLVINQVCEELSSNNKHKDIDFLTINLSGQTLSDDRFLEFVINELDAYEIDPEKICFEITETSAIANWMRVTKLISTLRGMGCKFALDDFGSGMSSFNYLRKLHVDFIKIDGSFVRNIDVDNVNHAMVEAIHTIGRVMGIATIAEFIENDEVLEELDKIGVDYAQGFNIHRPEPF